MNDSSAMLSTSKKGHSDKIFVDVVDIMTLTGKSKRTSERYILRIKDFFGKQKHQPITIDELKEYFGIC